MKLTEYLAKSNGEHIISHTDKVISNVKYLSTKYKLSNNEKELLILSATLHDIGKLTKKTQRFLKKGKEIIDNNKIKFTHNIIGWYFIVKYVNHADKYKLANLVLWHHGNYDSCENLNVKLITIRNEITDDDLALMKLFCINYGIQLNDEEEDNISMETEFYRVDNLHRSLLVCSDVCASSNKSIETLFKKNVIDKLMINQDFINSDRTKKQLSIINSISKNGTTLIKAPTGFGKTMMAILWSIFSDKQAVWVCPTNTIADSIFDDIIRDLEKLEINISVELYLTGERKKCNNTLNDFASDIIITNIDNFTKPSVSNSYGERALMIYDCDVIFDEVHEFNSMDCALNAAFNNIMDKRHNKLESTTLMLTATQTPFRFLNKNGKAINVLPNEHEHYKAVHSGKYFLNFHESVPFELMKGEFVFFCNLVSDVQSYYSIYDGLKLISHGRYLEEDKDYRKNLVLKNYGKDGEREQYGVFTNQMLTTSCNYSVKTMFIKCPTIQSFIQAMGRVNRWGDMGDCQVHIILEKSRADIKFIGGALENNLQSLFIGELRKTFENKAMVLDELYVFYDKFVNDNMNTFNDISRQNLEISKNMLKIVYPRKTAINKNDMKVANGNKLRKTTSSDEIFIQVKKNNSDEKVILSINVPKVVGSTRLFNENEKTYGEQVKLIKKREGFNKYKKITPESIRSEAIYYDTPYPVFNHEYDSELGLRKIVIINEDVI